MPKAEDLNGKQFNFLKVLQLNMINKYQVYQIFKYENSGSFVLVHSSKDINYNDLMPNIKAVLDNYAKTDDIQLKNYLLKSIIEEIIYFKEKGKRNAKFEIDIKLKI